MQCRSFISSNLSVTKFDASLDVESSNPGIQVRCNSVFFSFVCPIDAIGYQYVVLLINFLLSQIFEKVISPMYLGEIVRRVLLKMARETAFFDK